MSLTRILIAQEGNQHKKAFTHYSFVKRGRKKTRLKKLLISGPTSSPYRGKLIFLFINNSLIRSLAKSSVPDGKCCWPQYTPYNCTNHNYNFYYFFRFLCVYLKKTSRIQYGRYTMLSLQSETLTLKGQPVAFYRGGQRGGGGVRSHGG